MREPGAVGQEVEDGVDEDLLGLLVEGPRCRLFVVKAAKMLYSVVDADECLPRTILWLVYACGQ